MSQVQSAHIFSLAHTLFLEKKKKALVSCPHLKIGSVPLPPPKSGFPFSNNNNKSKHFCVTHYVPGAVPNGSFALLLSSSEQSCDAGACIIVPTPQLGTPRPTGNQGAPGRACIPVWLGSCSPLPLRSRVQRLPGAAVIRLGPLSRLERSRSVVKKLLFCDRVACHGLILPPSLLRGSDPRPSCSGADPRPPRFHSRPPGTCYKRVPGQT